MKEWRFDGFPGRVLFVNLSSGTVEARSTRAKKTHLDGAAKFGSRAASNPRTASRCT